MIKEDLREKFAWKICVEDLRVMILLRIWSELEFIYCFQKKSLAGRSIIL